MDFKITAKEVASIWKFVIGNQAHLCFLEHWMYHAEDKELKSILQYSKDLANQIVNQGLKLYQRAGFPSPIGFSLNKDVSPEAPKLMSDKLVLIVLQILSEYGVYGYGLAIGKITTPDVLSYFKTCLNESVKLYETISKLIQKKGYEHQQIYIPQPKQAE